MFALLGRFNVNILATSELKYINIGLQSLHKLICCLEFESIYFDVGSFCVSQLGGSIIFKFRIIC